MTRRQQKYIEDLKKKMAKDQARRTREAKKDSFATVMAKEKIETYGDLFGVFDGLSERAKNAAVLLRIQTLAVVGYSPAEIVKMMEPKRRKRE
jgi:hypothetical protein